MDYTVSINELRGQELRDNDLKVDTFLASVHRILKAKGFTYKRSLQSALYHAEFTCINRRISISGWHGTGKRGTSRWYGEGKTFFSLYDSATGDHNAVVNVPIIAPTVQELQDAQHDGMVRALAYLKAL